MTTPRFRDPAQDRYRLVVQLITRLVLFALYFGLLAWFGAPAWAFVLLFPIATDWGPVRR